MKAPGQVPEIISFHIHLVIFFNLISSIKYKYNYIFKYFIMINSINSFLDYINIELTNNR